MTRARWRVVLWLGTLAVAAWMVWQASSSLLPFAVGAIVAYALSPLVDRLIALPVLTTASDTLRRGLAVGVIYLVLGGAFVWVSSVALIVAANQIVEFVNTLPQTVDAAQETGTAWLERYRARVPAEVQTQLEGYIDEATAAATATFGSMARRTLETVTSTIGLIFGFAVVPFFMFYAMRDRSHARAAILKASPPTTAADVDNLLRISDVLLGRFLKGQLLLGLVVGSAVGIGLGLLGVPLSVGLAVIAGFTELVPVIGPWLGAIPGLLIVLATDPGNFVWVALLYLGVQLSENYLLVPRIQGGAVELHPAMVLVLLVVFGAVMGFWGLVVAVPLTAILRELFWYADARLRGVEPAAAFAATRVGQVLGRRGIRG